MHWALLCFECKDKTEGRKHPPKGKFDHVAEQKLMGFPPAPDLNNAVLFGIILQGLTTAPREHMQTHLPKKYRAFCCTYYFSYI